MKKWLRDFAELEAVYAPSSEPPNAEECEAIIRFGDFIIELVRRQVLKEALDLYESRLYYVHGRLTEQLERVSGGLGAAKIYQSRREPEGTAELLIDVMVALIAAKPLVAEYAKRLADLDEAYR